VFSGHGASSSESPHHHEAPRVVHVEEFEGTSSSSGTEGLFDDNVKGASDDPKTNSYKDDDATTPTTSV